MEEIEEFCRRRRSRPRVRWIREEGKEGAFNEFVVYYKKQFSNKVEKLNILNK